MGNLGRRKLGIDGTGSAIGRVGINVGSGGSAPYNPTAQAYFDAVDTAGGSVTSGFKDAFSTLMDSGDTNSWLDKMPVFSPAAGGNEASAEINAVNPGTFDDNFINSPTIDATMGVTFDGTTQYGETGFIPSTHLADVDNWQVGVFCLTPPAASGGKIVLGVYQTGGGDRIALFSHLSSTSRVYGNGASGYFAELTNVVDTNEMFSGQRRSDNDLAAYANVTEEGTNATPTTPTAITRGFYYGCTNNAGSTSNYTDGKWCCKFIAENMTRVQYTSFVTDLQTFLTAIGVI